MRLPPRPALLAAAIALNLLLLLRSWGGGPRDPRGGRGRLGGSCHSPHPPPLSPGVTVVLRDFEEGDNDVAATAASFVPSGPVLVVAEEPLYPPLPPKDGVSVTLLSPPHPGHPPILPLPRLLRTQHVAFVPDGTRDVPGLLEAMEATLERGSHRLVAAPVGVPPGGPRWQFRVDLREWTLYYHPQSLETRGHPLSSWLEGPHVLLLRTRDLLALPFPLARPVLPSLLIQGSLRNWSWGVTPGGFPFPPQPPRALWKARNSHERRHRDLMRRFGIKREALGDGGERWHGCSKATPRCFGTIRDRTPSYLHLGRWTPPCCLRGLRETTRHVVGILESAGIRYWLEGGSLLGAVRSGDLIPWDYDVDLGFYRDDLPKCPWLANVVATGRPQEDPQGFLWEKAAEGEFFRVHFSPVNRLHVDLWPFYSRGGQMTKETWLGHPQDVEFPERFLLPRLPLPFVGIPVMAPNHPREFLEFKFGAGAVEEPEYPNPGVRRLREGGDPHFGGQGGGGGDPPHGWGQ